MFRKQPGFLGVLFLRRAEDQVASITVWEYGGAVEALESSPSYRLATRELAESGMLAGGQAVEIFEVTGGALRTEPFTVALNPGDDPPSSSRRADTQGS
jgi:heme-degrading monooxygenase HmoA